MTSVRPFQHVHLVHSFFYNLFVSIFHALENDILTCLVEQYLLL